MEKLYDRDSHLRLFTAKVISCVKEGRLHAIVLDRTAFYPEGGGQQANGVLSETDLERIENLANAAIFEDLEVEAFMPDPKELSGLSYRTKIPLDGDVRIVRIPGYDACACCDRPLCYSKRRLSLCGSAYFNPQSHHASDSNCYCGVCHRSAATGENLEYSLQRAWRRNTAIGSGFT